MRVEINKTHDPFIINTQLKPAQKPGILMENSICSGNSNSKGVCASIKGALFSAFAYIRDLFSSVCSYCFCGCCSEESPLNKLKKEKSDFESLLTFFKGLDLKTDEGKDNWFSKFDSLPLKMQHRLMRIDFRGMAQKEGYTKKNAEKLTEDFINDKMGKAIEKESCLNFIQELRPTSFGDDPVDLVEVYLNTAIIDIGEEIKEIEEKK